MNRWPGGEAGPARSPEDVEALAALLRDGGGAPLAAVGGRTCLSRGADSAEPVQPVDLSGWNAVLEHAHADLTVTVQSGVTASALSRTLEERNQWLPPVAFTAGPETAGGLIASDRRHPLAGGLGTVRDYLIGVGFLDGRGRHVRAGGRVVKNVAGYDLMKLLVGSLGELGIVVEAVFKVLPRPACWGGAMLPDPSPAQEERSLRDAPRTWFPAGLWRGDLGEGERLWTVFAGAPERVAAQQRMAAAVWGPETVLLGREPVLELLAELTACTRPSRCSGWGGALPSTVVQEGFFRGGGWLVDLLAGHVWWSPSAPDWEHVREVRGRLPAGSAHLHLENRGDRPAGLPVWGREPGEELSFWRGIKHALDPEGRLPSGRLPGGL